jgi:hypothetical protein
MGESDEFEGIFERELCEALRQGEAAWISDVRDEAVQDLFTDSLGPELAEAMRKMLSIVSEELLKLAPGVSRADAAASLNAVGVLISSEELRQRLFGLSAEALIFLLSHQISHSETSE